MLRPNPHPRLVILRSLAALLAALGILAWAPELTPRASAQPPAPAMQVLGDGQLIPNGSLTPSLADGTDFGEVRVGGTSASTFYVENDGTADLRLTGTPRVTISGSAAFTVTLQPSTPIIPGGSAPFIVQFLPTITGTQTATVSIASNDTAANPYVFTIQGTGFTGPAVDLDMSVGTGGGCPVTSSTRVAPGTSVTYCYRVRNTGTLTVTLSSLNDTAYGALLTDEELELAPDEVHFHIISRVVTETTVSTATWTVSNPGPTDVASATDTVTVVAEFEAPAFTSGAPPAAGPYGSGYSFTFSATGLPPPTFSVTAGSLPPGLSLNGTTGVLTGTLTAAGTYTFTVTAANGVNPAATRQVVLGVARVPLTITADNKSMLAGQALPTLTARYSGFVRGDTSASLDTPARLSTTATRNSPPGTYPITVSGAADANYTITFVPGTLTISESKTKTFLPQVVR